MTPSAIQRLREAIVAERGNGAATYVAGDTRRDTDTDAAIAAVERELAAKDAEITRLRADQPRIPNAARLTTIANIIDRECDKFTFHWPTKRTETWRSEAAFLRALAGQTGTEPPQPAEGA